MILAFLLLIPLFASILSLFINDKKYSLLFNIGITILSLILLILGFIKLDSFLISWIPSLGINIDLRLDALSFVMLLFTHVMNILGLWTSYYHTLEKVNIFYFLFMLVFLGANGVFLSFDLFLFFIFWELMIIPLYFLILIYGGIKRYSASTVFLLITQISGLCLFLGIIILVFQYGSLWQDISFSYDSFLDNELPFNIEIMVASLFLVTFLVKLSVFPFHIWLQRVFVFAPLSVLFVGILVKTGVYGILRFFLPIFSESSFYLSKAMFFLGAISLLYGAIMAFAQKDIRRLLSYITVSHMGLILIGLFSLHEKSLDGALLLMIGQGLSMGGILFILSFWQSIGLSMELRSSRGLLSVAPKSSSFMLFFVFSLIGLPGLAPFIGEFYILFGSFYIAEFWIIFILLGLLLGVLAMLGMIYYMIFGKPNHLAKKDFTYKEKAFVSIVVAFVIYLGLYPKPLFELFGN